MNTKAAIVFVDEEICAAWSMCAERSCVLGSGISLFQQGQPVPHGELDETRQAADAQLVHQTTAASLDGLEGRSS